VVRLRRVAYGKSQKKTGMKSLDGLTDFGVKVWQVAYVRGPIKAYKRARK